MTKSRIARLAAIGAGAVTALSFAATAAAAMTNAEIMAAIAQLQAQLAATGGATVSVTFTRDLTVGSRGADVTALQNWLIGKGYSVPAGATGYFGGQTRAAVAAWQAASGVTPAAGYFGPKSRAYVNAIVVVPGGTTTGGTTVGGSTSGGITTPGVEGTLTVTLNPTPGSGATIRENDMKVGILGIKLEARRSDIKVERVKLDLGTNSTIYTKVFSTVYVTDEAGNVLATVPLNSSNVTKEDNNYFVTITGFNYVVPKDSTKVLVIKADVMGSFSATTLLTATRTITVPANGVRGVDGAGIDQYGPSASFSRSVTLSTSLAEAATFQLSLNSNTQKTTDVIANGGTANNEADAVTLGSFDFFAQKDNVLFTDFVVQVNKTGSGTATATTAYLYDGNTQIASATVNSTTGIATFSNFDLPVSKDATKTLTLKVDIRSANATAASFSVIASSTGITSENSQGSSVTGTYLTGSGTSNVIVVKSVGPVFTLLSKSVTKSATSAQNNSSTSTLSATFNVQVKAVGADVLFGTQASTTKPAFIFGIYKGGVLTALAVSTTSSITLPESGVITSGLTNSFTLQQNNTVTLPVTFLMEGRLSATGALIATDNYSAGIEAVQYYVNGVLSSSTYMAGQSGWRTDTVALP